MPTKGTIGLILKEKGLITVQSHLKSWVAGCLDSSLRLTIDNPANPQRSRLRLWLFGPEQVTDEVAGLLEIPDSGRIRGSQGMKWIEIPLSKALEIQARYGSLLRGQGRDLLRISASWQATTGLGRGRGYKIPEKIMAIRVALIKEFLAMKQGDNSEISSNESKLVDAPANGIVEVDEANPSE